MARLTHRRIEAARATGKDYALPDGGGLYLRVSKAGTRSWAYRYQRAGTKQQVWLKLGDCAVGLAPGLTLLEARAKALDLAGERRRDGVDPKQAIEARAIAKQNAEAVAQARSITVDTVFEQFRTRRLSMRKDGGKKAKREYDTDIRPYLGVLPIRSVTRSQVVSVLDRIVSRGSPVQANRTLQLIGQLFKFAIMREIVEVDPTRLIEKKDVGGREGIRERVLSEDEIRDLCKRLETSSLPQRNRHAIWIMLATLARVGELSAAKWSDIDLERGMWTIPQEHSKNGYAHTVQLSPFARAHFEQLQAIRTSAFWVFAARPDDECPARSLERQALSKALVDRQWEPAPGKKPLRGRLQLSSELLLAGGQWRSHDLRRTGATLMGELGIAPHVIERCLNHRDRSKVERTYQRQLLAAAQREAWMQLGARLEVLMKPKESSVMPLRSPLAEAA